MYYTDEKIKEFGESIKESLLGFTKEEIETLFEKYILPIYSFTARRLNEDTKWKSINRETEEVFVNINNSEELFRLLNN